MCVKMIRRVNDEEGIKVCIYLPVKALYKWQFLFFNVHLNVSVLAEIGE